MKKYIAEPPNFNYTLLDYLSVINSMRKLQLYKDFKYEDEREKFEEEIKKYLNIKYAIGVTNCASGIDLACEAINLNQEDEVLSCAINFYGTHLSVLRYKAKLVLVEPKNNSVQIDVEDLYKKINIHTKAIIITQMNGGVADIEKIREYVKIKEGQYNKKIYIIEDVARAFGAEYHGNKAGTLGDIGVFSFQTKKNFCTLGEGGMVVTNNSDIYMKVRELRAFEDRRVYGTNYKLSRVQCAVGISQLKKLDKNNSSRIKVALERNKLLEDFQSDIYIEKEEKNIKKIYTYYNVILNEKYSRSDRDRIREILLKKYNISTCVANEPTYITHRYIEENVNCADTPLATDIGGRIISLPIHFKMKRKDNQYIVNALIESIEEVKNGYI